MTPPAERLTAALADRYRLERELGAGGMATVYLAEDLKHRRQVAIKVLKPDLAATLGAERFQREIGIAAQLSHPHILGLHDSGEADGFLYYVMPLVEGTSLREKLVREGELPIPEAVRILRDVADAMAYAHERGVVHRDIKPENVMLTGRHAMVMDFGVAKAVAAGRESGGTMQTSVGVALGTPAYMSPEQASADPHVDHRSDLYAWGIVAYELLAGQPPFVRSSLDKVLIAQVTVKPEPVSAHRENVPAALAQLIMRCLEKRPADRPQSAGEILQALETVLTPSVGITPTEGHPPAAGSLEARPTPGVRPARWRRVLVASGLLLATATVLVIVRQSLESSPVESDLVLVTPLETTRAALDAVALAITDLPTVIVREGVGTPVSAATVRDLASGREEAPSELATYLTRRTRAGLLLRTSCDSRAQGTTCTLELFRMPQRAVRLSVPVTGAPGDTTFARRVQEQALVILLLQQRWGDRTTWEGEYISPSLEATRAVHAMYEAMFEARWGEAPEAAARAARLDTNWIRPRLMELLGVPLEQADSVLAALSRREGLSPQSRAQVELVTAVRHDDLERAFQESKRQFARWPDVNLHQLVVLAAATDRANEVLRLAAMAESLPHFSQQARRIFGEARDALDQLGRHQEGLAMTARFRERFPEIGRGAALRPLARLGDVEGVKRILAELEGELGDPRGTGTQAWPAGQELEAHGYPAEAQQIFELALPLYRKWRMEEGNYTWVDNELDVLEYTGRLAEARELVEAVRRERRRPDYEDCELPAAMGRIAARQGRRADALAYGRELDARIERSLSYPPGRAGLDSALNVARYCKYVRIAIAALLGDRERAMQFVNEARRWPRSPWAEYWILHRDPHLASMRGYPPFDALLKPKD